MHAYAALLEDISLPSWPSNSSINRLIRSNEGAWMVYNVFILSFKTLLWWHNSICGKNRKLKIENSTLYWHLTLFFYSIQPLNYMTRWSRKSCTKYFSVITFIDTPSSQNVNLCNCLTIIMFKAKVLHKSDRENQLGCLRRKEKLSWYHTDFYIQIKFV